MSIRSQKKRLTLIFKKNYLHTFHHYVKQSSTISFNKSPREAFKNLFTKSFDPRIIRLFLIDNIQLQLLSFLSLYKLHFHITRSCCSTTHLDDIEKLRKPVTQVTKSSNLRIIPQSQWTIFNFDSANG